MEMYNLMSCKGFIEANEGISLDFGLCAQARLVLVGIFFLNALVRKWGGEELGIDYNFWYGLVGGFLGYLIPITLTGNIKLSFLISIALMLIGGYGSGYLFGGGDSYD